MPWRVTLPGGWIPDKNLISKKIFFSIGSFISLKSFQVSLEFFFFFNFSLLLPIRRRSKFRREKSMGRSADEYRKKSSSICLGGSCWPDAGHDTLSHKIISFEPCGKSGSYFTQQYFKNILWWCNWRLDKIQVNRDWEIVYLGTVFHMVTHVGKRNEDKKAKNIFIF